MMADAFTFNCGYNGCSIPQGSAVQVLSIALVPGVFFWLFLRSSMGGRMGPGKALVAATGLLFLATLLPQTLARWQWMAGVIRAEFMRPASEKRARLFGDAYTVAARFRKSIPGYHAARLITTIDLRQGDGWGIHDRLAYYLYPLDIRTTSLTPEVFIFFHKKEAIKFLPSDVTIIDAVDKATLLAVRRQGKP